jgi:hypothetical protein
MTCLGVQKVRNDGGLRTTDSSATDSASVFQFGYFTAEISVTLNMLFINKNLSSLKITDAFLDSNSS